MDRREVLFLACFISNPQGFLSKNKTEEIKPEEKPKEIKKISDETKWKIFFWDEYWAFEESFWNC